MRKIYMVLLFFGAFGYLDLATGQTIDNTNLAKLRRKITSVIQDSTNSHAGYNKTQINAIVQALEDWYNTNPNNKTGSGKSQFVQVVNTAQTAQGLTLTNLQKKIIISIWLLRKIEQEIGLTLLR